MNESWLNEGWLDRVSRSSPCDPGDFVKFWLHTSFEGYYIGQVKEIIGEGTVAWISTFTIPLESISHVELRDINLFGLAMEFNQLELVAPDGIFVDMPGLTLSIRELYEAVINR